MLSNKGGFKLFDIMGFRVSADWSWLFIAVLLSWSLASGYFPAVLGSGDGGFFLGLGIVSAMLLFFSVVLHEVGHSYVARQNGIRILGIRLFIFGGVAQMDREPRSPMVELKVALAGPAVSAALALGFFLISEILATGALAAVTLFVARANLAMVLFNMIPGFPMDGGRVLRAYLWQRRKSYYDATKTATTAGRYVAYGFMGLGALMMLSGAFGNGLWLVFIGMFLNHAARSNQQYAEYRRWYDPVDGWHSKEMEPIDGRMSVQYFEEVVLPNSALTEFAVVRNGRAIGVVAADSVQRVPWFMRGLVRVADIAQPRRATSADYSRDPFNVSSRIQYKIYDRFGRLVDVKG